MPDSDVVINANVSPIDYTLTLSPDLHAELLSTL
jgi:hypothetical protein